MLNKAAVILFLFSNTEVMAVEKPLCFRPQDMSNSKAVKQYLDCRKKNEGAKPLDYLVKFPANTDDINPQERCTIYRDGSYKCLQDPVRFVVKEKSKDAPMNSPIPETTATATPTTGDALVPINPSASPMPNK